MVPSSSGQLRHLCSYVKRLCLGHVDGPWCNCCVGTKWTPLAQQHEALLGFIQAGIILAAIQTEIAVTANHCTSAILILKTFKHAIPKLPALLEAFY